MKTSSKKWQKIRKIKGLRQFVTWYPRHVSENPGYNLNDFADFGSILLLRQNDTFFFACIDKAKNDIAYINEKTHPQMYKEIGDIVFEMAMDTYGHYFSGIVVLVEVEPNTYKMIEK